MSKDRRRRIEALFEAALDQEPGDRAVWLDAACAGDPDLRREVDALLAADSMTAGILDVEAASLLDPPASSEERRIGPYRVIRELGRGGMGVVYLAERDDGQFRRRVALKLLRGSPDADELHRRFQAERQILASLDHPNIAQLLDGGVTDGKLPYLVIEFVEGRPINEYCDRRRLDTEARLRLFLDVCAAVHHAHRNLVLHRDLKPGNILVTETGQVKLLDFGIAKLLNPSLSAIPQPLTRTAFRVLTPEYASPEQVRGEPLSTASDVYALGVVLYELLTGRRPYVTKGRSPQELALAICEQEPVRPSTAVTQAAGSGAGSADAADADARTGRSAATIASSRAATPERLRKALRGDIDAIVLMALRKEANHRYNSADVLAQDINRYLAGMPVLAHKGSRVYSARKFLRRHAASVGATAIVLASIVGGAGAALWQAAQAGHERDRAELALRQSEAVTNFLVSLFEASDPLDARGDSVTARELLRRGTSRIESLAADPVVQANLLEAMARVHTNLGHAQDASPLIERALSLRIAAVGEDDESVTATLSHLAETLRRAGRYAEAEQAARRALDIQLRVDGPNDPSLTFTMNQIAGLAIYRGDLEAAESLTRQALEIRRQTLGDDHPDVAINLESLGAILRRRSRYDESEAVLREAIDILERRYGRFHAEVANAMFQLAYLLDLEDPASAEAESLMRQAIEIRRQALGEESELVATGLADLGELLSERGEHAAAAEAMRSHLEILEHLLGTQHLSYAVALSRYAGVLHAAGRFEEARDLYETAYQGIVANVGPDHGMLGGVLIAYAATLEALGEDSAAEHAYRETIDIRRRALGSETSLVYESMAAYAGMLARHGRDTEADAMLTAALGGLRRTLPDEHPTVQQIIAQAVEFYEATGRRPEAERYRTLLVSK